jgi:Uma2 family endonuclease
MATAESTTKHRPVEQRFLLHGVDWSEYRTIADALGERHLKLAYDGWNLEFRTVSHLHNKLSRLVGRFVVVLTEELGLPIDSIGSTTLDREDARRALEPDECFYLQNEALIRDKDNIDLEFDPPPDLAVEIDVSRSSLNRLDIAGRAERPFPHVAAEADGRVFEAPW